MPLGVVQDDRARFRVEQHAEFLGNQLEQRVDSDERMEGPADLKEEGEGLTGAVTQGVHGHPRAPTLCCSREGVNPSEDPARPPIRRPCACAASPPHEAGPMDPRIAPGRWTDVAESPRGRSEE